MGVTSDQYDGVFKAIESGEIINFDSPKLLESNRILAGFHTSHAAQDQTAAALLMHSLQIARTLREIDRSNRNLQRFVIILAVVTLIVGGLQTHFTVFQRSVASPPSHITAVPNHKSIQPSSTTDK